jgi:small subunit ribosomal protein S16
MVTIRLRREGIRNRAFYRIVVLDHRKRRDGGFIEILGHYDPHVGMDTAVVDLAKVDSWVSKGSQMSDTVRSIVKRARARAATAAVAS